MCIDAADNWIQFELLFWLIEPFGQLIAWNAYSLQLHKYVIMAIQHNSVQIA